MTSLPPGIRARLWTTLNYAGAAALVVLGALAGATEGLARVVFVVLAAGAAVVQLAAQSRRSAADRRAIASAEQVAEDVRTLTNNAISNVFTPILRLVAQLHETADPAIRSALRAQIERSVVYAAAGGIGPDTGVRSCFYALVVGPAGRPERLVWSGQHAGRADEPHTVFAAGTAQGDSAITMVVDDTSLFCADTRTDPPPGWHEHPHGYRTFLAVPVRGATRALGMLTVDSQTPGDLDADRDTPILVVLARILAVSQFADDGPDL